jgi:hypothetical protein
LTFESGSKLSLIEGLIFYHCYSLKSILIPASVEVLANDWAFESSLSRITFESGALLQRVIGDMKSIPDCQIEIPSRDDVLNFPGYSVLSCHNNPSIARLVRLRTDERICADKARSEPSWAGQGVSGNEDVKNDEDDHKARSDGEGESEGENTQEKGEGQSQGLGETADLKAESEGEGDNEEVKRDGECEGGQDVEGGENDEDGKEGDDDDEGDEEPNDAEEEEEDGEEDYKDYD